MILINKSEKEAIIARYPRTYIARTCKQNSKKHHYYCEESKPAMRYLKELRGEYVPAHNGYNKKSCKNYNKERVRNG